MAVFRVQVHYKLGLAAKWSNVWHVSTTALLDAASAFVAGGVPHLLSALHVSCQLDHLLVSDPGTGIFVTVPVNESGVNGDTGDMLPLFNTIKVLFPSPSFGRPDLKYLKGMLTEGMQTNFLLTSGVITGVDAMFTSMVADMATEGAPLCGSDGVEYVEVEVQQAVQMRQMHRKRKKKVVVA